MRRALISLLLSLSLAQASGCDGGRDARQSSSSEDRIKKEIGLPEWALPPLRTAIVRIRSVTAEVELAFTPQEQAQGLMYRTYMDEDHGMLFVYRKSEFLAFWMKNTRLPLSIAFIKTDGTIDVIRDMEPFNTTDRYRSKYRCQFALEMNRGWFSRHGIRPGDPVEMPSEVKKYLAGGDAALSKWRDAGP